MTISLKSIFKDMTSLSHDHTFFTLWGSNQSVPQSIFRAKRPWVNFQKVNREALKGSEHFIRGRSLVGINQCHILFL